MRLPQLLEHGAVVVARTAGALLRRAMRGPLRPSWSLRTEVVQTVMRTTLMRSKTKGVPWLRDVQAAGGLPSKVLREVEFEPVSAAGVPAAWCTPKGGVDPTRTLLYLHGGGYVIGSVASYRDLLARIAVGAEARVLGLDYRLAPEHPFPAAQEDSLVAARWLLEQGTPAESLAIAGDSAGGALTVATLCALRDAGDPLPAAGALICPWTDPFAEGGSMETSASCDFGDRQLLVSWIEQTLAGADPNDPRVRVIDAKLEGLPPLLVQAGGAEILLDQIHAFVERAQKAGVDITLQVAEDMFHDFQIWAALLSEGASAVDEICHFLRARLAHVA